MSSALRFGFDLAEVQLSYSLFLKYIRFDQEASNVATTAARKLNPNSIYLLRVLAIGSFDQGEFSQAETYRSRAALLDPLNQSVGTTRFEMLMKMGRYEQAMDIARYAPWMNQPEPDFLRIVATRVGAYGDLTGGLPWVKRSLDESPNGALSQLALVQLYQQLGNYDLANAHLQLATDSAPENLSVFVWRAKMMAAQGDIESLLDFSAQQLDKVRPDDPEEFSYQWFWSLYYRGTALLVAGDHDAAIRFLQMVDNFNVEFDLIELEVRLLLTDALLAAGREDEALVLLDRIDSDLEKAKDNGWGNPQLTYIEAGALALRGESEAALSLLQQVLADGPTAGTKGSWKGHWSLGFDPVFDSLRDTPAFQALLNKTF